MSKTQAINTGMGKPGTGADIEAKPNYLNGCTVGAVLYAAAFAYGAASLFNAAASGSGAEKAAAAAPAKVSSPSFSK